MTVTADNLDVLEATSTEVDIETAGNPDVLEVAHNGAIVEQLGGQGAMELVRRDEVQVVHGESILQVFENGFFGGGGTGTGLQSVDFTARDSTTHTTIYIANSSALEGSEDPAAAEWQIARYDSTADPLVLVWADGDQNFDNILDTGGATPEYETYTYS